MKPEDTPSGRVSLLGPKSVLSGDLVTTEELVILGRLEGARVQSPSITIGPCAHVAANIFAKAIRIEGVVIGDVYAETSAVIHGSASVQGNIWSPQLTIHEGATVEGLINKAPLDSSQHSIEASRAPLRAARRAR